MSKIKSFVIYDQRINIYIFKMPKWFESSIDEHWQLSTVAGCTIECDKRLIKNGMNQMPRVQLYY